MFKRIFQFLILFICGLFITSFQSESSIQKILQKPALRTIIIDAGHGLPDPGAEGKYSTEADCALAIALKLGEQLQQNLPNVKIVYTRTDRYLPDHLTNHNEANHRRAQIANENHGDLFLCIHLNEGGNSYQHDIIDHRTETYYTYSGTGSKRKKTKHTHSVPVYNNINLGTTAVGPETYIWAVGKSTSKKDFVGAAAEDSGEMNDSSDVMFDSPEAKILASLRVKKYFNNSRMLAEYVQEEFTKQGRPDRGVKQRDNEGIWVLQATAMPSILVETGFINNREEEDYLNSDKGQNEVAYAIMRAVLRYKESLENGNIAVPVKADSTQ